MDGTTLLDLVELRKSAGAARLMVSIGVSIPPWPVHAQLQLEKGHVFCCLAVWGAFHIASSVFRCSVAAAPSSVRLLYPLYSASRIRANAVVSGS